jgi:uncharacterized protein (DUF4415 family)
VAIAVLNVARRHMTTKEKVQALLIIEPIIAAQRAAHKAGDVTFESLFDVIPSEVVTMTTPVESLAQVKGKTHEVMAAMAGVSPKTWQRESSKLKQEEAGVAKTEPTTKQVNVRLPLDVLEMLETHAQRLGISQTEMVIRAVRAYEGPRVEHQGAKMDGPRVDGGSSGAGYIEISLPETS